ncbi:MAG: hypothetical protein M0Q88_09790 [Bacilli bacterium]|nr:hypothetical protein [Bacilli bacterium]
MIKHIVLRIYHKLTVKGIYNDERPEPDIDKWQDFVNSFPEPKDDFEQTYFKYLCRLKYFPFYYTLIINFFGFFALLYHISVLFKKPKDISKKTKDGFLVIKNPFVEYDDVLPEALKLKYGNLYDTITPQISDCFLDSVSRECLKESFKRYPFSFYFNFILFRELAMLSYYKSNYSVKAIVFSVYERQFTSPLMTYCCEKDGYDFVSFQHGEYLLNFILCFRKFTTYFIWDKHYIEVFDKNLRCSMGSYQIYTPLKYQRIINKFINHRIYEYYITYYLSNESKKRLKRIANIFTLFKNKGYKCCVRPHPRHSDMELINEYFKGFTVEDPYITNIEESIMKTKYATSLNSTVLTEAFYGGKTIVIDDYSEPERYYNLKKRKYIMLDKPHILLTDLVRDL